jgi:hypothetical protein
VQEFESFVYLDVQKTGSTFISFLLRKYGAERQIRAFKHKNVGAEYDKDKFHFISIRNPLDQYISLYSYGCSGSGGLFKRLARRGMEDLYDSSWKGFKKWLRFVLDEENAPLMAGKEAHDYRDRIQQLIGFQTYRFLELALAEPNEVLAGCNSREDVREAYGKLNIAQFHVRHESFQEDLKNLLTDKIPHAMADLDGALKFVAEGEPLNTSLRIDSFAKNTNLGPKLTGALQEREWLMSELFGY